MKKCEHCSKLCSKRVAVRHEGKILMVGTGCSKNFDKATNRHLYNSIKTKDYKLNFELDYFIKKELNQKSIKEKMNSFEGKARLIKLSKYAWQMSENFSDLILLNCLFLKNKLFSHPNNVVIPEYLEEKRSKTLQSETDLILDNLISINKLGLFTDFSQPGLIEKNNVSNFLITGENPIKGYYVLIQRAAVSGFVEKKDLDTFLNKINSTKLSKNRIGIEVITGNEVLSGERDWLTIESDGNYGKSLKLLKYKPYTFISNSSPISLYKNYIGEKALIELTNSYYVQFYDKIVNDNYYLWRKLIGK